jgi:hypothetical protein
MNEGDNRQDIPTDMDSWNLDVEGIGLTRRIG